MKGSNDAHLVETLLPVSDQVSNLRSKVVLSAEHMERRLRSRGFVAEILSFLLFAGADVSFDTI